MKGKGLKVAPAILAGLDVLCLVEGTCVKCFHTFIISIIMLTFFFITFNFVTIKIYFTREKENQENGTSGLYIPWSTIFMSILSVHSNDDVFIICSEGDPFLPSSAPLFLRENISFSITCISLTIRRYRAKCLIMSNGCYFCVWMRSQSQEWWDCDMNSFTETDFIQKFRMSRQGQFLTTSVHKTLMARHPDQV